MLGDVLRLLLSDVLDREQEFELGQELSDELVDTLGGSLRSTFSEGLGCTDNELLSDGEGIKLEMEYGSTRG